MEIVRRVHSMKEVCRRARANGRKVGFVPTMGALHPGHLSLIRRIKEVADVVVVSIFVNPTQFGSEKDLDAYPRDLTRDVDLCVAEEVDYVFAPPVEELYPSGASTYVEVGDLSDKLEGSSREGHFRGVATIVLKLFQIVQPAFAAFGQKDAQQAVVIERLVCDLMLDVEILVVPIVRDDDGVALSSRNVRLSQEQREAARAIPRALEAAQQAVTEGERQPEAIAAAVREVLQAESLLQIDYVELVNRKNLERVSQIEGEVFLLVAVHAGEIRLLDNAVLSE